jgi:hypothetical protein
VALVRTDVSEEHNTSIIRMKRLSELVTTLTVTFRSVLRFASCFCLDYSFHPDDSGGSFVETSITTRATRRHIPEDAILHSPRHENLTHSVDVLQSVSVLRHTGIIYIYTVNRLCLNLIRDCVTYEKS